MMENDAITIHKQASHHANSTLNILGTSVDHTYSRDDTLYGRTIAREAEKYVKTHSPY